MSNLSKGVHFKQIYGIYSKTTECYKFFEHKKPTKSVSFDLKRPDRTRIIYSQFNKYSMHLDRLV